MRLIIPAKSTKNNVRPNISGLKQKDPDQPGGKLFSVGAYRRPEGPPSIALLALLPPLHQSSYLRYAQSRGLGSDAGEGSAAEALLLRSIFHGSISSSFPLSSSGRVGVASPGQWWFAATGPRGRSARDRVSRLSFFRRARALFLLAWCVPVDPSTTAAGCWFEHAVGLVLKLSGWLAQGLARGLKDGRLCRLSGRVLFLLTSNLLFAVHDLFSRLDSIRSRHLL
ncbi:hypothetical protein F2Q70_00005021 [Brassica cretica]|uniref:Uncharacterized protein n=1 Tax=Brassica cretica TaxID=69181 RepID=A0A8S9INZ4_BRACR|nr:hypothetical protein F2Q70_00005021 [Brassica cretica]